MFSIPTIMTILLFTHAIQATNNTEPSSSRIVPIFSNDEAPNNQISSVNNQSTSPLQPDAQVVAMICPSDKPSCETIDGDGDVSIPNFILQYSSASPNLCSQKTEFRCQAPGPLKTCPCCPQSQLPDCEPPNCMAQPLVSLCKTTLLQVARVMSISSQSLRFFSLQTCNSPPTRSCEKYNLITRDVLREGRN